MFLVKGFFSLKIYIFFDFNNVQKLYSQKITGLFKQYDFFFFFQENPNVLSSVERQFKVAESGLETLELLFEKTKEELSNSNKGFVSEIALLFGSTPMTPKQVYIIHLPEVCLGHSSVNHPERKHLFHLLQYVPNFLKIYNKANHMCFQLS